LAENNISAFQNLAHTIPLRERLFQIMEPIREELKAVDNLTQCNNENTMKEDKMTDDPENASTSSSDHKDTKEDVSINSNEGSASEKKDDTTEITTAESKPGEENKTYNETKANVNTSNPANQPLEGPLTKAFKDFMVNMWHGKGHVFSPQSLFLQIKKK